MPTCPRIDLAGYHHVINRGVNRCNVFNHNNDKDMFLQIINKTASIQQVILHDYVLMDNHYHLLIETQKENLPTFMRIVNANYSQYFNRKYRRSGHLWQDRYKSKFITSDDYLYTLIRYIENNPVEANITQQISTYPFTLSHNIYKSKKYNSCCKESILLTQFDIKTLRDFLEIPISQKDLEFLEMKQKQKIEKNDNQTIIKCKEQLSSYFNNVTIKKQRNSAIITAYLDGYTQVGIANHLNLSKSLISKVIKSGDSTPGV